MKNEDELNQPPEPRQLPAEQQSNQQSNQQTDQQLNDQTGHQSDQQSLSNEPESLVDELGIYDIYEPMADLNGKIFCTAGRDAPVAEFSDEYLIMHPPQLPLYETGPEEEIVLLVDDRGIVLNELGEAKKIPTAKYRGYPIYYFGEQKEGTSKHYAAVMTENENLFFIFDDSGERLTTDVIYKLRNKSVNGEISKFPGLHCDLDDTNVEDDRIDASTMVETDFSPN